jgi:hypothetical protein
VLLLLGERLAESAVLRVRGGLGRRCCRSSRRRSRRPDGGDLDAEGIGIKVTTLEDGVPVGHVELQRQHCVAVLREEVGEGVRAPAGRRDAIAAIERCFVNSESCQPDG